ncbi:MAG: cytochrome c maturation protein CcmE [candidate division Zixibacteria bacterium]|nr:cytochrome c maturation protein CcmE [candidate division Zixibacteria bacterium]
MPKNIRTIIAVAAIVIFGGLGIWSLVDTATPYVGFEQARTMPRTVQVMGKVEFDQTNYDEKTGVFSFMITDDKGDRMQVDYSGTKPGNFEQAESVVCIGKFENNTFIAKDLLVKCPSKYQGQEYQESSGGRAGDA